MKYYITPNNSDLLHFGILGMKWGVRRYQNKDGSLTSAGRKRYLQEPNRYENLKNDLKKSRDGWNAYRNAEKYYFTDLRKELENSKEYKESSQKALSAAKEIKKLNDEETNITEKYWNSEGKEQDKYSKILDDIENKRTKEYHKLFAEENNLIDLEWKNIKKYSDTIVDKYVDNYVKDLHIKDQEIKNMFINLKNDGFFDWDIKDIEDNQYRKINKNSMMTDLSYEIGSILRDPDYFMEKSDPSKWN